MSLKVIFFILISFLLSPTAFAGSGSSHCPQILKEVEIVVGVLLNEKSEVLLGKRQPPQDWVGYWEFPGGKVDPGETPEQALVREMKEEVGLEIEIKTLLDERLQNFDSKVLRMRFYLVSAKDPRPQAIAHSEVAWFDRESIRKIPFLVPDHPIFQKIF